MEGMEEKLNSILSNPQMMQQIMSLAQNLGQGAPEPVREPEPEIPQGPDPAMLGKAMALFGKSNIDPDQRLLLKALNPYLPSQRIARLERAMRAAKLAGLASTLLRSNTPSGR